MFTLPGWRIIIKQFTEKALPTESFQTHQATIALRCWRCWRGKNIVYLKGDTFVRITYHLSWIPPFYASDPRRGVASNQRIGMHFTDVHRTECTAACIARWSRDPCKASRSPAVMPKCTCLRHTVTFLQGVLPNLRTHTPRLAFSCSSLLSDQSSLI